jgi:hypothetical protein
VRNGVDLTTFIVPKVEKIRSLNLPEPQGSVQACSGKSLPFLILLLLLLLLLSANGFVPGGSGTIIHKIITHNTQNYKHNKVHVHKMGMH